MKVPCPETPPDGGGVPVGERGAANRDAADGGERMRNDKETDKEKATAGERGGAISGNPSSGSLKY